MSNPALHLPAVYCNSGPLRAFGKLNRLDLLAGVYPQTQIPEAVYHEVVTRGVLRNEPDALQSGYFCAEVSGRSLP